jgi:sugar phosphate isomerase/epimerase
MSPVVGQLIEMSPAPLTIDRLCIHQVTLMQCDFRESIECLARHDVTMTAVWRDKLDGIGVADAVRVLNDNNVDVVSLCAGGLLTSPDPGQWRQALDDNQRWIEQAAAMGATSMVTITGGFQEGDRDADAARARALEGLARLVPHARAAGVRLALEPLHPMVFGFRSVISTMKEANAMLDLIGADDVMGLAVDTYALWWDSELEDQIDRAGSRIINFHVSDWLPETRDIRLDRGMPGDGLIDNRGIRERLESAGFDGPIEVEIFSEQDWWKRGADFVVQTILDRYRGAL